MMSMFRAGLVLILGSATLVGCADGPEDPLVPGELVARVDDVGLSVEAAAELLAPFDWFANNEESARSLAELWLDYTVLSEAVATDPALANVDLSAVRELQERELAVLELRDLVIEVDTAFTDEELRARFEEEDPADRIRARHILIVPPEGATEAERDSVRAFTDSLRLAILAGKDFGETAIQYSADFSANDGGDLGYFGRGEMVAEFEEAAFGLAEGELSEVVRTPFGFHIIQVSDRIGPTFEEARDRYRSEVVARARAEAEGAYIGGVADEAGLSITERGPEIAGGIVGDPWTPLDPAVAEEPLAEWDGGAFTAGDLHDFVVLQPRENILQLRAAQDFPGMIRTFALQELLVAESERQGIDPDNDQWEFSSQVFRQQASTNATTLDLAVPRGTEGDVSTARQEAVRQALAYNLIGEIGLLQLGPVIGPLREGHELMVSPDGLSAVVARIEELRAEPEFEPFLREQPSAEQPAIEDGPAEPGSGAEPNADVEPGPDADLGADAEPDSGPPAP